MVSHNVFNEQFFKNAYVIEMREMEKKLVSKYVILKT